MIARILLVEDETDIADMLEMFFTWRGYDLYHAFDGDEALNLVSRVVPHLILMDISLPGRDGYALTEIIRQRPRTAHIPIIFLTTRTSRGARLASLELGADDYITKPFDIEELLLRAQNSIARSAREYLTDLRTGLPAAFTARKLLDQARFNPDLAIIEVLLENSTPYVHAYGSTAGAAIYRMIANLMLAAVNDTGDLDNFIGYLDEDQFVIVTEQAHADAVADAVTAGFNETVARYYSEEDQQRRAVQVEGTLYPLMRLVCRITVGAEHTGWM